MKTGFVILDFTYLKSFDAEIFIVSFPFKGGHIPSYAKVFKKKDLDSLKYKSKEYILQFRPIVIRDREFWILRIFKTFKEKRARICNKVKKGYKFYIVKWQEITLRDLKIEKHTEYLKERFICGVSSKRREEGLVIICYSPELINKDTFHIALKYIKRMLREEKHIKLKSRLDLLGLNREYYKELYNEEFLDRYLIILI